jgi:undecaprenyl pyrophosphate phosphatase UppP
MLMVIWYQNLQNLFYSYIVNNPTSFDDVTKSKWKILKYLIVQVAIVVVIGLVLCVWVLYIQTFFNKSKIKWNKIVYSILFIFVE